MVTAKNLEKALNGSASEKRKKTNEWFFKTGKGQYGEGDIFIGVAMPDIRKAIKPFMDLPFGEIGLLLDSPLHEVRMSGVLILTENAKKAVKKEDKSQLEQISNFYLKNRKSVNNWDLIDVSVHYILGNAIINNIYDLDLLDELSSSASLWDRRMSMVATWAFIRNSDVFPTIALAKKLLGDKEDLMHKAIGWMLRESWKREPEIIEDFLLEHYNQLPRTTLRYAIERMEESKRKDFLNMKIKKER